MVAFPPRLYVMPMAIHYFPPSTNSPSTLSTWHHSESFHIYLLLRDLRQMSHPTSHRPPNESTGSRVNSNHRRSSIEIRLALRWGRACMALNNTARERVWLCWRSFMVSHVAARKSVFRCENRTSSSYFMFTLRQRGIEDPVH